MLQRVGGKGGWQGEGRGSREEGEDGLGSLASLCHAGTEGTYGMTFVYFEIT